MIFLKKNNYIKSLIILPILISSNIKSVFAQQGIDSSLYENYHVLIKDNTETQKGLLTIHKVDGKYYFEIPEVILGKEILIATKISDVPKATEAFAVGAGSQPHDQQIIRFQKQDYSIVMKVVSYKSIADKNLPIHQAAKNSNSESVVYKFKIEAINKKTGGYVIGINDFFTSDIPMIGAFKDYEYLKLGISNVDQSRSFINWIKAFPENIEIRHTLTYRGSKLSEDNLNKIVSVTLNQSMVVLPNNPMTPRFYDERVGYFSIEHIDYGLDEQKASTVKYIQRWRLEPSDWKAFSKGDLVEPVKPILFYIDPATPLKWRPYIRRGVEAWQKSFEQIGFKNAIGIKDAPTINEDPDWSPEDIRYSVIRWMATTNRSANGPNIHDPRTGEIIEADILFGHNMMRLLRNWYFTRTAAANPKARPIKLKDEVMGKLIQIVISHEVGHTLGLLHNSITKNAFSIDSLRSPSFTTRFGSGASIMDNTENYIAQPMDGVTNFYSQISEYDMWAIRYGYKPLPNVKEPEDEKIILSQWIEEKENNPLYKYINKNQLLGSDQILAAELGIKNLKLIMRNIIDWSTDESGLVDYEVLEERYDEIITEFNSYVFSLSKQAEGYFTPTYTTKAYIPVSSSKQKEIINFLNNNLFKTPDWLLNKELYELMKWDELKFDTIINRSQNDILNQFLSESFLEKKQFNNLGIYSTDLYSVLNMISDIKTGIFSELKTGKPIDIYRRGLQKLMVDRLGELKNTKNKNFINSDIPYLAKITLESLKKEIKRSSKKQTDLLSKFHLQDLLTRIEKNTNS